MGRRVPLWGTVAITLLTLGVEHGAWQSCRAEPPKPLPSFERIEELVLRHFAMLPDYEPDDYLAQSQVEPAFGKLRLLGWPVVDWRRILRDVPSDKDFLGREFRTPEGRLFMRKIATIPHAYSLLDRLSQLRTGRPVVKELIHMPDGHERLAKLATGRPVADFEDDTPLGRLLASLPEDTDLTAPTHRIYTAAMLLERLRASYAKGENPPTRSAD